MNEPTSEDLARDLEKDYRRLERLAGDSDTEWCPFLNPSTDMEWWKTAIRRALHAEERARTLAKNLDVISRICGEAGIGSEGQSYVCRVMDLKAQLGHQIERADVAESEVKRLQGIIEGLTARVVAQSDMLTRKAEKRGDAP